MSQNKSNKVTYNQHKFSPQLKKISWDYPYSDANHFTVVSNTNKLMLWKNHAKSLKNDFYFIHRYRAYFGGLFSFRVLNKRTGRYTNFASGFSFFNPKSERGWAYISKGRVLWPAEKIVENIIKKKLLCFHKTNDGRFLASALMTSNKLPALPQRRNFSWHYRMHMRNHLHSHFNRAFRLFAPQVNATGLDAVASGVAAANEFYRGKLFSIIPSVRAAQLTNYMFMKAERSKMLYDTRYMFPETPALAIRSTLGLGFRSEIARAFDSFSGDRSPMRYGWSSFSFRPFNTSGATRVEEITKEFNRGIGNIKPLSYKSAFYMLKHLKVRARASTEPWKKKVRRKWIKINFKNFFKNHYIKGGLFSKLARRVGGERTSRFYRHPATPFHSSKRYWRFKKKYIRSRMGGSRIRSSINRRMYASYGFGALDFKRVIRLKLLDQMGRTLTRRKKVKRFFKASWSNPEKVAKSYRRRF